jgi:hypothetical protein
MDESDAPVAPEVGDMVDFTVSAKLVAVNGDMADVEIQKVNGNDLGMPAPEAKEEMDEADFEKAASDEDEEKWPA